MHRWICLGARSKCRADALTANAPQKAKPAPKIPRNTEPCPLWQFVAIFLAVGGAAFATAAYGLWWLQDLLTWAGL